MNRVSSIVLRMGLPALLLVVVGCARTTAIESDLVLDPVSRATIQLRQATQAIELHNDSDANVRIRVLDRKKRLVSDMPLGAHDRVRLDLDTARAVELVNSSRNRAKIRWILRNDGRIEYALQMGEGYDY